MISTCPHCLEQINHDDSLFEVACTSCNQKFNPFLSPGDVGGELNLGVSESPAGSPEPAGDGITELGGLGGDLSLTSEAPPGAASEEGNQFFQELRDFGENLVPGDPNAEPPPVASPPSAPPAARAPKASPPPMTTAPAGPMGDALILGGDAPASFQVESYFPPVSAWCDLAHAEDPLRPGLEALWAQAAALGANAIFSLRWELVADGSRALLSGIPARGTRTA